MSMLDPIDNAARPWILAGAGGALFVAVLAGWLYVHGLKSDIAAAQAKADKATGDLVTCRGNAAQLEDKVKAQNASIEALAVQAARNRAGWEAAQAEIAKRDAARARLAADIAKLPAGTQPADPASLEIGRRLIEQFEELSK